MNHLHALKQPSTQGMGRWSQISWYHVRIPVDACDPCSTDKAVICGHFLSPVPVVPSPKDHEWGINVDEQLVIQWMCGATSSYTALQLMFSMCKKKWKFPGCIYLNNDPNYTNLCKIANQFKPVKCWRASDNREDEDEALDGKLKGAVSMYMCQHPLSYIYSSSSSGGRSSGSSSSSISSSSSSSSSCKFYFHHNTTMKQRNAL